MPRAMEAEDTTKSRPGDVIIQICTSVSDSLHRETRHLERRAGTATKERGRSDHCRGIVRKVDVNKKVELL